eukprot:c19965_g1_i11.p1 GENE.c19965_g1_i11~~c19965_g1_i11.p1  ORF type:complete len:174 (+),score=37.68 c19965_g1_i11:749-1270(+)
MDGVDVVMAADIIYDNEVTAALVQNLSWMLQTGCILIMTTEYRENFVLDLMRVCSPAHEALFKALQECSETFTTNQTFQLRPLAKRILCGLRQRFSHSEQSGAVAHSCDPQKFDVFGSVSPEGCLTLPEVWTQVSYGRLVVECISMARVPAHFRDYQRKTNQIALLCLSLQEP